MQVLPKSLLKFYVEHAIKPFKWLILGFVICLSIIDLADGILFPKISQIIVRLFENSIPAGMGFVEFVIPTAMFIFGFMMFLTLGYMLHNILENRMLPKTKNNMSEVLNNYVHKQSTHFFSNRMSGKINSQIGYITSGFMPTDLLIMIISTLILIINTLLISEINFSVSMVILFGVAFRIIWSLFTFKKITVASKKLSETESTLSGKIVDSISNFQIIKLFSGNKYEEKYIKTTRTQTIQDTINLGYKQRWFWGPPNIMFDFVALALVLLCGYLFSKNLMGASDIVYAISVYFTATWQVRDLTNVFGRYVKTWGSAKQAYSELVKPLTIVDKPGANELIIKKAGIEIKNISFKYGKKKVIDNLSIKIKPGEKVGLVGLSGAGKTTLVNLLMRLYDVNSGQILFDGQNIKNVTQESLRNNITFIPQEPSLFNRTLLENIAYGDTEYSMDEIRNAAKRARADDFIMVADKKYDTIVGDRGIKLSGGQKQRVVIARAFLRNTPILILDEATSALDSETEKVVQHSFEELSKNRTTIVIAHRLSTLQNMDKIIVLEDGQIKESGNHKVLIKKKNGLYCKLWKLQNNGFIPEDLNKKK